jgi:MOSC domain-containing protein YiiM
MPHIASITYTPSNIERKPSDRYARMPTDRANLIADFGIQGDAKGGARDRQLNIMLAEVVEQMRNDSFHTNAGELGEQIVIAGLLELQPGARLSFGKAVIEVASVREPCGRFEHIQGQPKERAVGRIGYMARVITGGEIAVGDPVHLMPAE